MYNSIFYIRLKNCKNVHFKNVDTTNTALDKKLVNKTIILQKPNCTKIEKLRIINREDWLAQPPVTQKLYLEEPAKFVIISHTATYDGTSQAENIQIIKKIQKFHIESKKWHDIGYNFLVGSDGNVYEGRGWGIVGAHTFGYNHIGIGISFVGCFLSKLPPNTALHQAKELIKYGVEIGQIDKNYMLVGHCQCSPTASPGTKLFEDIQSWNHWTNLSDMHHSF